MRAPLDEEARELAEAGVHPSLARTCRLSGEIGRARGELAERRVVALLGKRRPSWVVGVRLAEEDEDRRGIDVVVQTDVGPLPLQVKVSAKKATDWLRRRVIRGLPLVGVVVAPPELEDGLVWAQAIVELLELRESVLEAQRSEACTGES